MNMQYAIADDKVYVLEANPRASRTVPLVSKVCDISMVRLATTAMVAPLTGRKPDLGSMESRTIAHFGVKEAVFPFNMFPEVDPVLGPEMRSTGEVLGISDSFGMAYYKAQEATQVSLPVAGTVLLSVTDRDKPELLDLARELLQLGFRIMATDGTCRFLRQNGIECDRIKKIQEGRPNIPDAITNKEIQLVINTPMGRQAQADDSYIRKAAIKHKIAYITTMAAARAAVKGIAAFRDDGGRSAVKSLQEYHANLRGGGPC